MHLQQLAWLLVLAGGSLCLQDGCEVGDRRPDYGGDDCHYQECGKDGSWQRMKCGRSWYGKETRYNEKEKKCENKPVELKCEKVAPLPTTTTPTTTTTTPTTTTNTPTTTPKTTPTTSLTTTPTTTTTTPTTTTTTPTTTTTTTPTTTTTITPSTTTTTTPTTTTTTTPTTTTTTSLTTTPTTTTTTTPTTTTTTTPTTTTTTTPTTTTTTTPTTSPTTTPTTTSKPPNTTCTPNDRRPDYGGDDCHYQECRKDGSWHRISCKRNWYGEPMHYNEEGKLCESLASKICKAVPPLKTVAPAPSLRPVPPLPYRHKPS